MVIILGGKVLIAPIFFIQKSRLLGMEYTKKFQPKIVPQLMKMVSSTLFVTRKSHMRERVKLFFLSNTGFIDRKTAFCSFHAIFRIIGVQILEALDSYCHSFLSLENFRSLRSLPLDIRLCEIGYFRVSVV